MRWVLAGIAFALMVGTAVATAAIESTNIHARLRLEQISRVLLARRIEHARRVARSLSMDRRAHLERMLRGWLARRALR